jgi:hypothetical protein
MRSMKLWALMLLMAMSTPAAAQNAPTFVFTVPQPDANLPIGEAVISAAIGERSLLLFQGSDFDPGISTEVRSRNGLVVRSSLGTVDFSVGGQRFRTFQQVELLRPLRSMGRVQLAVGGGVRQEWGGAQTVIGRVIAGARFAGGQLEGNAVFERHLAVGTSGRRDPLDVITTVGWAHALSDRVAVGVEGIGQDLEGFWDREEAEGGARLLIGPSIRIASANKRWSLGVAGGPLLHSPNATSSASPATSRLAVLGSLTCALP